MPGRTFATEALVIKHTKVGEADRVVTLLTKDEGKIVCVAKGVRKLTSSKRASLESGNHVKAFLVKTQSLPILTQTSLVADCSAIRSEMSKLRQLTQLLEIIDALLVESTADDYLFDQVIAIRDLIVAPGPTSGTVKTLLENLLVDLGYQHPSETKYQTILEYVSVLADKPMRSWEYLKV